MLGYVLLAASLLFMILDPRAVVPVYRGGHEHAGYEHHDDVIVGPPVVVVRPPEIVARPREVILR